MLPVLNLTVKECPVTLSCPRAQGGEQVSYSLVIHPAPATNFVSIFGGHAFAVLDLLIAQHCRSLRFAYAHFMLRTPD